jgi:cytochrome c biogenesis protein
VLRRRRFRRRRRDAEASPFGQPGQLAAERGHWREGGSLVFHTSFYVLLAGAVIGHAFGFVGQVNVVEGERFADTRISLRRGRAGRWFDLDDHRGFVVRSTTSTWLLRDDPEAEAQGPTRPDAAATSCPRVTILEDGEPVRTDEVRVNHPLEHDGMKLYQVRFGIAPRIEVVRSGGPCAVRRASMLIDEGGHRVDGRREGRRLDVDNQIALELVLLPDADEATTAIPSAGRPEPNNPRLVAVLWYGELGFERPSRPREFDREAAAARRQPLILAPGETSARSSELGWRSPSRAALLVGVPGRPRAGPRDPAPRGRADARGLIPSLYAYRRRVWAEARATAPGDARRCRAPAQAHLRRGVRTDPGSPTTSKGIRAGTPHEEARADGGHMVDASSRDVEHLFNARS